MTNSRKNDYFEVLEEVINEHKSTQNTGNHKWKI